MGCGASRGAPKPETTEHRVLERAASASTCTAGTGAAAVHATPPALALVSTAPPPQLLLDSGVPDELILRVLSCLGAADLACLECVSRRFAGVSSTSDGGVEWFPARPATQWSIVQEAARRRLVRCSGNPDCTTMQWEPHSLPCVAHSVLCGARCLCRPRWQHPMPEDQGKERWVQLAYELELAQLPLTFDRSDATIAVSEGGALATKIVAGVTGGAVASSRKIMRTGRHFAEFTVVQPDGNAFAGRFGLIRPGKVPPAAARTSEFREAFSVKEVSFEVVPSGGSPMCVTWDPSFRSPDSPILFVHRACGRCWHATGTAPETARLGTRPSGSVVSRGSLLLPAHPQVVVAALSRVVVRTAGRRSRS